VSWGPECLEVKAQDVSETEKSGQSEVLRARHSCSPIVRNIDVLPGAGRHLVRFVRLERASSYREEVAFKVHKQLTSTASPPALEEITLTREVSTH
jgi:hypothetical protein